MADPTVAVEMRNITKRFPGVVANDDVTFSAYQGEVHALLGENGAGKSTLMNILAGLYRPDSGQIIVKGQPVEFRSPRDAIRAGVGMVHQHFMLVASQTVAENVILGLREVGLVLDTGKIEAEVERIGREFGLPVDPRAKIWQLSVGEQQRVEIIKLLYRGAEILILDEPTAVLTPQETETLFATLREMTSAGKTIILISHKLDEVLSIADRITVLRNGRYVATVPAAGVTKSQLASLMVGREVLFRLEKPPARIGEVRLTLEEVEALNDKRLPALRKLSLRVCSGEIVGIAGVAGNGQRELAEVICGLRPVQGGRIVISSKSVTNAPPIVMIEAGIAYVPEDRSATGSAPNLSIAENLALKSYRKQAVGGRFFLSRSAMRRQAQELIRRFNIAAPSEETPARLLSGGNLQKVILAREISQQPLVMIAAYPTRGLDVGATENVRRILVQERNQGAAILLISEDLDEIFALSDRIAVLYEGRIVGEVTVGEMAMGQGGLESDNALLEQVGLMMAGATVAGQPQQAATDKQPVASKP
ncbi:MAG TPA: ABC transporter ATP-binding protein [Caldilineaceae bacterium]|nr:ABC transporter ATP-binding protein [Caldilineaceae bacterium]